MKLIQTISELRAELDAFRRLSDWFRRWELCMRDTLRW